MKSSLPEVTGTTTTSHAGVVMFFGIGYLTLKIKL